MRRIITTLLVAVTMTAGTIAIADSPAGAVDKTAQRSFMNRVNELRASRGVPGLGSHWVLTAKAEAWAQHMADTGCLCHSNLADGVTVGWSKLGENIGRGSTIGSIHTALVNSPSHLANMLDRSFGWIGVGVAYGGGQMYVAEVFMAGNPPPGPNPALALDSRGVGVAARDQGGFWTLAGNGVVHAYEGAPAYGYVAFPGNFARDIAAMPDGKGYVVLDALGGVHRFGSARFTLAGVGGPWFGWNIARSIDVTADGRGFAVLDGFGGYHRYGNAPRITNLPYWPGWDIAKAFAFRPGGGGYVLDGFGAVWNRGGAPHYGTAYFGWNIARDLTVWPDGRGYATIDGFGGIHRFGSAKRPGSMPYQQVDRWRGVTEQQGTFLAVRNDGIPARA